MEDKTVSIFIFVDLSVSMLANGSCDSCFDMMSSLSICLNS